MINAILSEISVWSVFSFRVVTYNILADVYADSDFSRDFLFAHCPADVLSIDYRKQLLLKELIGTRESDETVLLRLNIIM